MIDPDTLTDDECLSLAGPWQLDRIEAGEQAGAYAVSQRSAKSGYTLHLFQNEEAALAAWKALQSAYVRQRLRELMVKPLEPCKTSDDEA